MPQVAFGNSRAAVVDHVKASKRPGSRQGLTKCGESRHRLSEAARLLNAGQEKDDC
jgi:hypothetical protein